MSHTAEILLENKWEEQGASHNCIDLEAYMIFLIGNSTKLFFPVFLINYYPKLNPWGIAMLVAELILYSSAGIMTIRGCFIISKSRVFHPNMSMVLCGFLMQWFECVVARILILNYQKGWTFLPGNGPSKPYSTFFTTNSSEIVKITSFRSCPQLFIGMFLITHYLVINILCLSAITTERVFATYLINDYESKKRPYISWTIFWSWQLLALLVAILVCSMIVSIYFWLVAGMMLLTGNCMGLAYIWYWNVRVHRILDKSLIIPSKYTLQARFQAKENMRSFHFTKYSLSLITATLFLEYAFIMCQSFDFLDKYEVYINYFMETCNSTHPNLIIPTMMVSVPSWRRRFFYHFKFIPGVQKYLIRNNKETATVQVEQTPKLETEEYFNQFKMAWG